MVATEDRITARIIVLLLDVMTVHEEAGGIVESALMIAVEVILHAIVQGAVLGLLNIVGVVVLVPLVMHVIETIAPLVITVLAAQGKYYFVV